MQCFFSPLSFFFKTHPLHSFTVHSWKSHLPHYGLLKGAGCDFIYLFIWLCQVLVATCGTGDPVALAWDLSSRTRDQTCMPWIARWILNRWTTREVARLRLWRTSSESVVGPGSEGPTLSSFSWYFRSMKL